MTRLRMDVREFRISDPEEPGRVIRGRIELPEGSEARGEEVPYVLILHGFKGFMDWGFFPELAHRIVARGVAAISFNRSGSGVGENPLEISEDQAFFRNTPTRELEDVARVRGLIDAGHVPGVHPARGAIFGHSMGGALALLHAAQRHDYRAVVVWAPVASFVRVAPEDRERWREQGFLEVPNARTGQIHRLGAGWLEDAEANAEQLDVEAACRRLSTPTWILHGTADTSVPIAEGERLLRAFEKGVAQFTAVEGADHTFGARHPLTTLPPTLDRALEVTVDALVEPAHP